MATDIAVVKKLEWRVFCSNSGNCLAATVLGEYVIQREDDLRILYLPYQEKARGESHHTLEAAKAAAQTDYASRILSALSQDYLDLKASHDAAVAALNNCAGLLEVLAEDAMARQDRTSWAMASVMATTARRAALTTPAAPAVADDGWIAWEGGECPVDGDTRVTVRLRNGDEHSSRARYYTMAIDWWRHEADNHGCDIVAYRPAAGGAL